MLFYSCILCSQITWKKEEICTACFKIMSQKELLFRRQNKIDIYSLLLYKGDAQKMILQCKRGQNTRLLKKLTKALMQEICKKIDTEVNGVIPIPPHGPQSEDHAFIMGREVAALLQAPFFSDILCRKESDKPQKEKTSFERKNIKFMKQKMLPSRPSGVWILVDDVITTGMTLSEAHKTLGEPKVLCLTLATRPYDKGIYE